MSFAIDPDAGQTLVLEPGVYGADGSAGCLKVQGRSVQSDKMREAGRPAVTFVEFNCYVDVPDGRVFVSTSPFGNSHTQTGARSGSKVLEFLANMGMDPNGFASSPDEDGNFPYMGPNNPADTKVILTVSYNARQKRNEITNIQRRQ